MKYEPVQEERGEQLLLPHIYLPRGRPVNNSTGLELSCALAENSQRNHHLVQLEMLPDLEVDQNSEDDPAEHDDSIDCPEETKVVDQDVPGVLWTLPEDLHTLHLVLDCRHCHNARENEWVHDKPEDVVVQEGLYVFFLSQVGAPLCCS